MTTSIGRATDRVLIDVRLERARQEEIGERRRQLGSDWRSCADPEMTGGDYCRVAVLGEEFGEAAHEVLEAGYTDGPRDEFLRAELVQVAAVAVAWVEAIDARAKP